MHTGESLIVYPQQQPLRGRVRVPGDKSISHRAVILATLASGDTEISGWLEADDTLATLRACEQLGATYRWSGEVGSADRRLIITGTGGLLQQPDAALDLGNSGTGVRLLLGVVSGYPMTVTFTGDASLSSRPMGRIVQPLRRMGARFSVPAADSDDWTLPLTSLGPESDRLQGIQYTMPVASAQVQAAILLAGLQAQGSTTIIQPGVCRDHSERMLQHFGADIQRLDDATLQLQSSGLTAGQVTVPADISSAAFLLAAGVLIPGSDVQLPAIGHNPSRIGILQVLALMQAGISVAAITTDAEPLADLAARHTRLSAVEVPQQLVANCIDEFPVLMALAATAEGTTRIRGAAELRVKETDRISAMADALQKLGVELTEYPDGIDITGGPVTGGRVNACGDHRIAMSLAVLGLAAAAPVQIDNVAAIVTSYPEFVQHLRLLGARIDRQSES